MLRRLSERQRRTMHVPIAIVLLYLPVSACQCVEVLHEEKQCMPGKVPFNTTETVIECMEKCFTQSSDRCTYLQWNVKTKHCMVSSRKRHLSKIGDCITLKKILCDFIYDSICFEPTSGHVYVGKDELTGLIQEEQCKTLCVFMKSCRAYTWSEMTSTCRIHRTTKLSGQKLQTGDTQAIKLSRCPRGRCVTLRASTFSYDGHKEELLTSVGECIKRSLNTTTVGKVDWNFNDDSCWSHTDKHSHANREEEVEIIQLVKPNQCQMKKRSVCMKKRHHAGMSDGYKIARVMEEDCVSLCYVVANCGAVELDGSGVDCVLHFVRKEIQQMQDHTLYVAHDCSTDEEESISVPMTSLATPSRNTRTMTVKFTDGRQNAEGTFRWSYYIRHTGYTDKVMRRTCLECALLCQQTNCSGFSCEEKTNGEGCTVNVTDDPMFSRTRLHPELLGFQQGH